MYRRTYSRGNGKQKRISLRRAGGTRLSPNVRDDISGVCRELPIATVSKSQHLPRLRRRRDMIALCLSPVLTEISSPPIYDVLSLHRTPVKIAKHVNYTPLYTNTPNISPAPSSKRTLPLNSTLWNSHGALKPTDPSDLIVRSPQFVQDFLAVTPGTIALSSIMVHSIVSALSVVVQSQRHHQCVCGLTWISIPCCFQTTDKGHHVL